MMKLRFFRKRFQRYEAKVLMVHEDYIDNRLKKAQDEGWEIAGQMMCHYDSVQNNWLHIPMKRRLTARISFELNQIKL